jgi:3-oxoacyl-[acyl-carrier protein] reductase
MNNLNGKVAIITGGGTGIGKAIALMLADEGVSVVVNYSRSGIEAEETADNITRKGVNALVVKADVSREDQVIAMFSEAQRELGRVDFLVNNAGYTKFVAHRDLDALTDEIWNRTLDVNLKGNMLCIRQAVKYMLKNPEKKGSIISIAGTTATTGLGSSIIYSASKAAILSLNRSLAMALAPDIQINAVSPGVVEDTRWCAGQDEFNETARKATPMLRLAQAEDIAEAVLYIFSSSHFITGQNIIVDGGRVVY